MYVKVTKKVAEALNKTGIRNRTADGCYLLWQADVSGFPGLTIFDRASYLGGKAITPEQAKKETDGTQYPVEVVTPERFGGESEKEENPDEEPLNPAESEEDNADETDGSVEETPDSAEEPLNPAEEEGKEEQA